MERYARGEDRVFEQLYGLLAPRLYREWPHALLIVPVDDAWARRAPDGGQAPITRA